MILRSLILFMAFLGACGKEESSDDSAFTEDPQSDTPGTSDQTVECDPMAADLKDGCRPSNEKAECANKEDDASSGKSKKSRHKPESDEEALTLDGRDGKSCDDESEDDESEEEDGDDKDGKGKGDDDSEDD